MKLSHLLLVVFLGTLLALLFDLLEELAGVRLPHEQRLWINMLPAVATAIILAWPVARVVRLSPLMIFSGPCPQCRQRPPGWWRSHNGTDSDTDRLALLCGFCGERVTLWLTRVPQSDTSSADVPTYALRWPEFLGIWRQVDSGNSAEN